MTASSTGQAVAAFRAELSRPHTLHGDPDAQARLSAGMRPVRSEAMRAALAARTRFVDEQVIGAIDCGIPQIVIFGAGYDDRSLRFRSPGVRFFELDHPNTQADKARRLKQIAADLSNIALIPADFARNDAGRLLEEHGHDASQPTLFICEGLLVYLDQITVRRLLSAIRRRADADSPLVASLAIHPEGINSDVIAKRANARRTNSKAEPWRTILPVSAYRDLFLSCGWPISQSVDPATSDQQVRAGRALFVVAVLDPT